MNPKNEKRSDFEPVYLYIEEYIYRPAQKELDDEQEDVERGAVTIDIF